MASSTSSPNGVQELLPVHTLVGAGVEVVENEWKSFRIYLSRLLIGILFFCCCSLFQASMLAVSDTSYRTGDTKLHDVVHELVSDKPVDWIHRNIDRLCSAYILSSLVRLILFVDWKVFLAIATRFLWCTGIVFVLRGIAIVVTTIPSPVETCVPLRSYEEHGLSIFWSIFQISLALKYGCTDMIISGHTVFITGVTMGWIYYSYKSKLSVSLVVVVALVLYALIILALFHYTVDVILAVLASVTVWVFYHLLLDIAAFPYFLLTAPTPKNFLYFVVRRYKFLMLLSRIIAWIEALDYRMSIFARKFSVAPAVNYKVTVEGHQPLSGGCMCKDEPCFMHQENETDCTECMTFVVNEENDERRDAFLRSYIGTDTYDLSNLKRLFSLINCRLLNRQRATTAAPNHASSRCDHCSGSFCRLL